MKDKYGNDWRLIIESDDDDDDDGLKKITDAIWATRDDPESPINPKYNLPHPKYHQIMGDDAKEEHKILRKELRNESDKNKRAALDRFAGGFKISHHLNKAAILGFKVHPYDENNRDRNILNHKLSNYAKLWIGRSDEAENLSDEEYKNIKGHPVSELSLKRDKTFKRVHNNNIKHHTRKMLQSINKGDSVGSAKHQIAQLYHRAAKEGFRIHHPDRHELSDMANRYSRLADNV